MDFYIFCLKIHFMEGGEEWEGPKKSCWPLKKSYHFTGSNSQPVSWKELPAMPQIMLFFFCFMQAAEQLRYQIIFILIIQGLELFSLLAYTTA